MTMLPRPPSLRYGLAVASPVALLAFQVLVLEPLRADHGAFLLLASGVLLSAWVGGTGPGLAATAVSAIGAGIALRYPLDGEYVATWKDGMRLAVFTGLGACLSLACGSMHADRRRAEQARGQLGSLLQAAPVGLAFVDRSFRFLRINDDLAAMNGHTVEAHLGRTVEQVMPESWPTVRQAFAHVLGTGEPFRALEMAGEHRLTGQVVHTLASYAPVRGDCGQVEGVGMAVVDISAQKRAEAALKDADKRKDEFLATLAHELRNPLAPLRTGLEILRRGGAESEEARAMMERQTAQLVRLVDDLLDLSRVANGKIELRRGRMDLAAVLRAAVEAARPLLDAAALDFAVDIPSSPLAVEGDPARLQQVFANLLNNASKFTPAGGRVELSARLEGGEAVARVRDTGVGIPPDKLAAVFEMFAQIDNSGLERARSGLGIGLTLVKRLAELHGGRIEASSAGLGHGCTFTVRLPAAREFPAAEEAKEEAAPGGGGLRILVVDDNRDAAASLAMLLGLMGHEARVAHDGAEGLQAARSFRPHAAFLDLGMPVMDGCACARAMRAEPCGAGVLLVALTGWGHEQDRRRTAEAGFDRHLTKPVDPDALAPLLEAARR